MTQEDKELLLTDLCARLPYGVIIQEYNEFSSYEDYIKYLKEKGLALEAPEGMYKEEQQ